MNIMKLSIQDYLKKINSSLTYFDILSLSLTFLGLSFFLWYLFYAEVEKKVEILYKAGAVEESDKTLPLRNSLPFGSKNGKTYTFAWCGGSGNIKEVNKIYFSSQEDAEAKGRNLSKLCKR